MWGALPCPPTLGKGTMIEKIKNLMELKLSQKAISNIALISLGIILIFSGIGKFIVPPETANIWAAELIGDGLTNILWHILPFVEIAAGIMLILRLRVKVMSYVVMGLIMNFITNNVWLISIGKGFETCGECLGWGIDLWPIGSLYIDLIMFGMLLMGVKYYIVSREVRNGAV